jgi:hypothetical protein
LRRTAATCRALCGRRVRDGDDPAARAHQPGGVANTHEEGLACESIAWSQASLDQDAVGAVLANPLERFLGGRLVDEVMDSDLGARLRELERDPAADAA